MNTWTVTATASSALDEHTVIGVGATPEQARTQLFGAAAALIGRAADHERPRYTLHLDGQVAAIIGTGDDELGRPDHRGAAELLRVIQRSSPTPHCD
jgi:hypothetical protein